MQFVSPAPLAVYEPHIQSYEHKLARTCNLNIFIDLYKYTVTTNHDKTDKINQGMTRKPGVTN